LAEWDAPVLNQTIQELAAAGVDIDRTLQFKDDELKDLLVAFEHDNPVQIEDGEVPLPPADPVTKPGTLWKLGNHRLLCADSSKKDDLERLLAGNRIHLVNTDPPYNVKVEPRSGNAIRAGLTSYKDWQTTGAHKGLKHHQSFDVARGAVGKSTGQMRAKDRPLINDFMPEAEFEKLLRLWFGNIAESLIPGRSFYIWGGYANCGNYPPALKESGLYFSQAVIWVKEHPVMTRKDFMGNHEWCFYGWREGHAHWFAPDIHNATDVWAVKKVAPQKMVHLTEKPVELAARAMTYSSRPGENVLDLFGGSGSTLIAAEQMGRKAFLMELDPAYCDCIVERWERLSGRKAQVEGGKQGKSGGNGSK
jgi:DNA modification methylase